MQKEFKKERERLSFVLEEKSNKANRNSQDKINKKYHEVFKVIHK